MQPAEQRQSLLAKPQFRAAPPDLVRQRGAQMLRLLGMAGAHARNHGIKSSVRLQTIVCKKRPTSTIHLAADAMSTLRGVPLQDRKTASANWNVFTTRTLDRLVECTSLSAFRGERAR